MVDTTVVWDYTVGRDVHPARPFEGRDIVATHFGIWNRAEGQFEHACGEFEGMGTLHMALTLDLFEMEYTNGKGCYLCLDRLHELTSDGMIKEVALDNALALRGEA